MVIEQRKRRIQRRMVLFMSVMLAAVFVIILRVAWIQFVQGKNMANQTAIQLRDNKTLMSSRGTIFDRNGREMAVSSMAKSMYANPKEVKDPDLLVSSLAAMLNIKPEDLKELVTMKGEFVWIRRMIEPAVAEKMQEIIKQNNITGLAFVEESKRYYPNDALAAQVLGFVGTDDVGLDGLEMVLDKRIRRKIFERTIDTDSRGIPIFKSIFSFSPPREGQNVYLTIDSNIQFIVEQSLDKAIAGTGAKAATVIVMDPKTGEILAMANRPTYNPNQFYRYTSNEWKNRAVAYNYEPGSTFKSIVAAAALQEGMVRPEEKFYDKGFVEVSGRRIKNWSGDSYGTISFVEIIKESINTGFVEVGMRLGGRKMTEYAKDFGFGKVTGIELPGEEEGLLFEPKEMGDSDTATMAIGQSIAVTPIQLITAVSAIANDGVLLKPHIIKEIRNYDGSIDSQAATQSLRQVISRETAKTLSNMMEKVVSEGGGSKAAVKGYRFAGKTGTAEKLKDDGHGYASGHYVSSFVGFGPVEDPKVVVLVVLDDPQGEYYGGQIAAPVAGEIFGQIMRHFNIRPQGINEVVLNPTAAAQKTLQPQATVKTLPPQQPVPPVPKNTGGKIVVPNLLGLSMREAASKLNALGLAIMPVGSGTAVRQEPGPNSLAEKNAEITVYFEGY